VIHPTGKRSYKVPNLAPRHFAECSAGVEPSTISVMSYRRRPLTFPKSFAPDYFDAYPPKGDGCSDILQQGIFDQYKFTSKSEYQATGKRFFSKTWEQLKQEHSSSHAGGSFDFFDIFSLNSEGGSAEDKFNRGALHRWSCPNQKPLLDRTIPHRQVTPLDLLWRIPVQERIRR
jgi:hypothetical protein